MLCYIGIIADQVCKQLKEQQQQQHSYSDGPSSARQVLSDNHDLVSTDWKQTQPCDGIQRHQSYLRHSLARQLGGRRRTSSPSTSQSASPLRSHAGARPPVPRPLLSVPLTRNVKDRQLLYVAESNLFSETRVWCRLLHRSRSSSDRYLIRNLRNFISILYHMLTS